ncbi:uncharacterized protein LOC117478148 [Trematomus bernacchii]|uniref:uncharacterized protein LOC117478148 n=1 Tax=Trematomus bernacchii TaxID=40690 RepID=UPI00146F049A|nr:uncharacterized protein LOC117478148 [Trematomus bernacchii]
MDEAEAEARAETKAEAEKRREERFLEVTEHFRRNALLIIQKMMKLNHSRDNQTIQLVDEILHSIFFLGKINTPPISPDRIVNEGLYDKLKDSYPQPFELYSSQLPRRSPFSCLLDMIVFLEGRENENEIKQKLQEIIRDLKLHKGAPLVSSTICVSQKNPNSARYYGVSMSTSSKVPRQIMIAASCLPGSWDSHVAGAVMSFNQDKNKKSYFDGTIKLPEHVTCKAYSLHGEGAPMQPCKSCVELFGLVGNKTTGYAHGNCAEVESVSNLFKTDAEVREQARPTSEKFTDDNRSKAEKSVRDYLMNEREIRHFSRDFEFYTPSE